MSKASREIKGEERKPSAAALLFLIKPVPIETSIYCGKVLIPSAAASLFLAASVHNLKIVWHFIYKFLLSYFMAEMLLQIKFYIIC